MRLLKYVVELSIVVLILTLPSSDALADQSSDNQSSGDSNTIRDLLSMLGGGAIGVGGSKFAQQKGTIANGKETLKDIPIDQLSKSVSPEDLDSLKRQLLKQIAKVSKEQQSLSSKIHNIEFFLGKKYQEFDRKDTYH